MITAQQAVDHLYRVAVTENKATSTARLDTLAEFCVHELSRRGLLGVEKDDLIGEVANAQLHSPEIVIGYVMIFNVQEDAFSPRHRSTWADLLRTRLESLSQPFKAFFDSLIKQVSIRNPNAVSSG